MNTFGANFKKASWKSLKDADPEWNAMNNALASFKATSGIGGIDDYQSVDAVLSRMWKDPGPSVEEVDVNVSYDDFTKAKSIYEYQSRVRMNKISSNKAIADAKAAVHVAHSKAVVMFDLAFATDSPLALFKMNLMEEMEEAWRVASANWREGIRAVEDDIDPIPEYVTDAGEAYEFLKVQVLDPNAATNGGVGDAWFVEHERTRYQASSVYIYRELWANYLTYATGQPCMHATYVQEWNENTDEGQTVTEWISKEMHLLNLLQKSSGNPMTPLQIDQHIVQVLHGPWAIAQFQPLVEDGVRNPGNRLLFWADEAVRISQLAVNYPLMNNQTVSKGGAVGARGVRTDTEMRVGDKRKGPTQQQGGGATRPNAEGDSPRCRRCDSYRHLVRECTATHCFKCGKDIPCPKEGKRTFHDATTCTAKTENRSGAGGSGGRKGGGSTGGGKKRTVDFAVADAAVGAVP
jgi:hypothetical protein